MAALILPASRKFSAQVEKSASPDYDARFVLSAASPDRVSDTIDPAAYDAAAKKADKLIALFNHDPDKIAGYWTKLRREGDTLTGLIKLASTNLGQMLKALVDDGVPLGASIGFSGVGKPNAVGGIHFSSIDLMETSLVSVPAHPRAVQIAKSFGFDLDRSGQLSAVSRRSGEACAKARRLIAKTNLRVRSDK
jgi:HK97 family phage prohead protease